MRQDERMEDFKLGSKVWYINKIGNCIPVEIMAVCRRPVNIKYRPPAVITTFDVYHEETNTMSKGVNLRQLSAYKTESLQIGDKVRSILGGGFTGEVAGYECETGRIICTSDKNHEPNSRIRYSYDINEIEKIPDRYTFELNRLYLVNKSYCLRAVESPHIGTTFLLVREETGKAAFVLNADWIYISELQRHGITTIERI
ncbi:MAG: hypothetical protein RR324_01240 [Cellulosilyticaceae bacterium]